jgi:hypothetical protein
METSSIDVLDRAGVEQCRHVVNLLPEETQDVRTFLMVCPDFGQVVIYPYLHPLSGADESWVVMAAHHCYLQWRFYYTAIFQIYCLPKHTTCLQKLYWAPLHWIEESTTDGADCVFSEFTALTSGNTFIQLHGHGLNPAVLYPAVDILPILVSCRTILSKHKVISTVELPSNGCIFLSIYWFEKNVRLVILLSHLSWEIKRMLHRRQAYLGRMLDWWLQRSVSWHVIPGNLSMPSLDFCINQWQKALHLLW